MRNGHIGFNRYFKLVRISATARIMKGVKPTQSSMETDTYILSFTSAGLAFSESIVIAETYLMLGDWKATKEKVKSENLIQARTRSSLQRVYREIEPRLKELSADQLELLVEGTIQEQKQLLWLAVCKRYAYIREFAVEVIHEKYMRMDYEVTDFDYDAFFNRKADWHEELDRLADSTRRKIKTVIFRMLREAEIIDQDHIILPTILTRRMIEVLAPDAPISYQIFPISIPETEAFD